MVAGSARDSVESRDTKYRLVYGTYHKLSLEARNVATSQAGTSKYVPSSRREWQSPNAPAVFTLWATRQPVQAGTETGIARARRGEPPRAAEAFGGRITVIQRMAVQTMAALGDSDRLTDIETSMAGETAETEAWSGIAIRIAMTNDLPIEGGTARAWLEKM